MLKQTRVIFIFAAILVFIGVSSIPVTSQTLNLSGTYNWKMTSPMPAGQDGNKGIIQFIKLMDQRTNGKVKITLYEGTLGAPGDHWDMAKNNAVQFAFTSDLYNAARMPILSMVGLPLEYPSPRAVWLTANEWLKAGYLKELTDNFKVLYFMATDPLTLFLRNKKVTTMNDFKGLKIRCGGSVQGQSVALLGATGVSMPGPDMYMAMSTGVIDGAIGGVDYAIFQKFHEVSKYALTQPLYFGIFTLLMNKDTWNGLPPELQRLIDQTANEVSVAELDRRSKALQDLWDTYGKKVEVYSISKEEAAKWKQAVSDVDDNYVKDVSVKGYPAREAVQLMRKVVSGEKK